jgi:simple sugar transport system ATP-binding protein
VSPSIPAAQATREQIGQWMSGLWEGNVVAAQPEVVRAAA